jgi:hypothetical protein
MLLFAAGAFTFCLCTGNTVYICIPNKIAMQDFINRMNRIEKLKQEANNLNRTRLQDLVNIVNNVLLTEGCPLINDTQIRFFPSYVGDTGVGATMDKQLSKIIYDYYFPKADSGLYAHFTSKEVLQSILSSQKVRLTSTIKRKGDGEFKLFYDDHLVDGYTKPYNAKSTYDEYLMSELFYMSLTKNQDESTDMKRGLWSYFGRGGHGVKLIFDIQSNHIDFRKVYYQSYQSLTQRALLHKLNSAVQTEFKRPLVFASISKIGSFYISLSFQDEFETRFLVKYASDDYPFPFEIKKDGDIPYIELDFYSMFGTFLPVKVQPGFYCDKNEVEKIVSSSGLNIEVLNNAAKP